MIDREHDLSVTKQAEILEISRGSVYYLPRPVSSTDLAIMQRIPLPVRVCCEACWLYRGARSAAGM
jgi:hypothetical protein